MTADNKNKINREEISFKDIGNSIKKSVNLTLKRFNQVMDPEALPPTRNPHVCAQKPAEENKANAFKAMTILSAIIFVMADIVFIDLFLDFMGFAYFLFMILSLLATVAVPMLTFRQYKEYKRLTNNYIRFLNELGKNTVISIRDLASAVAQSEEKTIEDLVHMMKNGYFHQARIVENGSLFLLDIPTFRLYKEKKKEIPEVRRLEEENENYELSAEDISYERAQEIIKSGQAYISAIKTSQQKIKDYSFKDEVDRIIKNSDDILKIVKKYPDKSYALNKFEDYYLPTTSKLIETYWEFEMMGTTDPKIRKSMAEIKASIATIADAFEKIKVELLSDRAMDVKTDIDTIELLLNQEGYTADDWRNE